MASQTVDARNNEQSYIRVLARLPKEFSYEDLRVATNNFAAERKLGEGGSGAVYKGILQDKSQVAVKRIEMVYAKNVFESELSTLASLRHKHLVRICGYGNGTGGVYFVVYDLLHNGSLDSWIFPKSADPTHYLSWDLRYKVAKEVAKALVYLHEDCEPRILHLDVKPQNILLDEKFCAVLADFGLSRLTSEKEAEVYTGTVRGTYGYKPPESFLSERFDIYSFGKVLLDIFFGQSYVCLDQDGKDIYEKTGNSQREQQIFHSYMRARLTQGDFMDLIDKRLTKDGNIDAREAKSLLRVALRCIEVKPEDRPSNMRDVLYILEGKNTININRSPIPVPPRVPEHFGTIASREPTKEEVIQALMDEKINLVGIYGMGGVGKTTLVKQIREEVEKLKLFDKVVLATVSQKPDLKWIQTQIAENLKIKLKEETLDARASKLSEELRKVKHILIILDDAWERLNLVDLGIVLGRVGENICKVLISSRILDVCLSMESKNNIEVNVLADNESLELFRCEVGDADYNAKREMSKEIVKECKGLPLAIVTLAKSLIGKDDGVWRAVIPQLQKSMSDRMDPVNASIKLSYDFLNINTRLCFLLCSLFPEDHLITLDSLIGYALGEGLLGDGETLREAKENMHLMVDRLVSSGLLSKRYDSDNKPVVMMHDIIRDTAVTIARDNSIIKARSGLKKWPQVQAINCIRMSLMGNDICVVPNAPRYSQLVTLSLSRNKSLESFPDGFFDGLKCLATLDLRETGIALLPQSILSLENCLRSLYLDECHKLQNLCGIRNLKALEILSFRCIKRSCIQMSLGELKGLTNLKMLDLVGCSSLGDMAANVISSLSSLEELYTRRSGDQRVARQWERHDNNVNFVELATLANMTSLTCQFHGYKFLSTDMGRSFWEKLTGFNIVKHGLDETNTDERFLMFDTLADSFPLADWVMVLLDKTYELDISINGCEGIKNILHLYPNGFYDLKSLCISSADSMEYIVDASYYVPKRLFDKLYILSLGKMNRLKAIWNGPIHENSFNKLKYLEIFNCRKLVNIFLPFCFGRNLQNLEENAQRFHQAEVFHVQGCNSSFYLSSSTNNGANNFAACNSSGLPQPSIFSKLKEITIEGCNALKCLFSVGILESLAELESLNLSYCDKMEGITEDCQLENEREYVNNKVLLPRLQFLCLMNLPRFSSFFSQQRIPHVCLECPSLVTIKISQCPNLNRLPFGLQSIPKLQTFSTDDFQWFEQLQCEDPSIKLQMQQVRRQAGPSSRRCSPASDSESDSESEVELFQEEEPELDEEESEEELSQEEEPELDEELKRPMKKNKTYEEQLQPIQNYFPLEKYSYL